MAYSVDDAHNETNIAENLTEDELHTLGHSLFESIEADKQSRNGWMDAQEEWLKLASQVKEKKNSPWPGASNVKYPLMTTACMQFHARALPGLINSNTPVMTKVVGRDPDGTKLARANRVRNFMSYQILEDMEDWLDEMDRMLFVLPMIGLCYKKSYYSNNSNNIRSVLCLPKEVIVNYHATSYERARITHELHLTRNEVVEMQRAGLYREVDLNEPQRDTKDAFSVRDDTLGLSPSQDMDDAPFTVYESHCWWDLDGDGYEEPYIVTLLADTQEVLMISPRWDRDEGVVRNGKGDVQRIYPEEFFTPYIFLPDPNSAVYGIGLGTLLGPTNEAVNTLINQLIDAGTLSNMQGGFLGRGMKIKGGTTRFRPGEWKVVNQNGADLKNSIVPMPVQQPSAALFNLLNLLINSGERISSVSDMMQGESPGQNQPASTSMAVLEQGLKVFSGIFKRIHRSLGKEYKRLYQLNYLYLDEDKYLDVIDDQIEEQVNALQEEASPEQLNQVRSQMQDQHRGASIEDFTNEGLNVIPASDPTMVSEAQRMVKARSLLEKLGAGLPLNIQEVTRKVLTAEEHEDIEKLMAVPQRGPSPEEIKVEIERTLAEKEVMDSFFTAIEKVAKAESLEEGTQLQIYSSFVKDAMAAKQIENQPNGEQKQPTGSPSPTA